MLSYSLSLRQAKPTLYPGKGASDAEAKHEHVDCLPDQRKWLERRQDEAATMRPHTYCVTCGVVKSNDGPKARKLGFYISGLSALKEYLGKSATHGKMTQAQNRLITKALQKLPEFDDPYGLSMEVQLRFYLQTIKRIRSDLDDELIQRLLPKVRRRSRKPLIESMSEASSG